MAINEQIVSGRKFRKCVDVATKLWQRISFWTKSSDVEFDDGKTAEEKLGVIDGITDSLASTSSKVALSAAAGKNLNDQLTVLNTGLTSTTSALGGLKLVTLTQAQYNALSPKDPSTLYFIR